MKSSTPKHLLIFGAGYVAHHVANVALEAGWSVSMSSRTPAEKAHPKITYFRFGDDLPPHVGAVLSTVPPRDGQDPVLAAYHEQLPSKAGWFGYISSTGVYGDTLGAPVTEESPLLGTSQRAQARIAAEHAWLSVGKPVHVFRLAGIYGQGRNMLERLSQGRIQNLELSERPVNRIHAEDIARAVMASMTNTHTSSDDADNIIYNLADDLPAPTKDVLTYAAKLLDHPTPPPAQNKNSHLMDGSRIVVNTKVKNELNLTLKYPSYREGLDALAKA